MVALSNEDLVVCLLWAEDRAADHWSDTLPALSPAANAFLTQLAYRCGWVGHFHPEVRSHWLLVADVIQSMLQEED